MIGLLRSSLGSSLGRVRGEVWPVVQAALAAGLAYLISERVLGHTQPIFAPTAAVVALAVDAGGRGRQAIQMLVGVGVGVAVGELLVLLLGVGAVQVALAAGVAMLAVALIIVSPLPLIQAGASAVLVVALQSPQSGGGRVLDALVGGGVALFVSQVLFPPSPVSLLRGAAGEALRRISSGLNGCADALSNADAGAADDALESLRDTNASALPNLDAARDSGRKVARRTVRGRREARRHASLDARLARIDLLAANALLIARAARDLLEDRAAAPEWPAAAVRELSRAVETLSKDPESPDARRSARDAAREAARRSKPPANRGVDHRAALAAEGVRLAASDVLDAANDGETEPAGPGPDTPPGARRGRERAP